jgi:hemin uptake protein HemP
MKAAPPNSTPLPVQPCTAPVPAAAPALGAVTPPQHQRLLRSDDLLRGQREVLIEHDGKFYSLRHTSNGKLILTK